MAESVSATAKKRTSREESRATIVEVATELVRTRSYAELSVGEIMARAGIGRTIFYRHFDDLADLLLKAGREAIEELYRAQVVLATSRAGHDRAAVREALQVPVRVYHRHGPVLRAVAEAAAANQLVATDQAAIRDRFDELVAATLEAWAGGTPQTSARTAELARALNLMNESYLLDTFGREPKAEVADAVETLTTIWFATLEICRAPAPGGDAFCTDERQNGTRPDATAKPEES